MPTKRDKPREFTICGAAAGGEVAIVAAAEGDAALPRFTGTAYTGAVMKPQGWYSPIIVDLDGVQVPSQHRPALRQHDHEQIVGHTDSVKVGKTIEVAGVMSGEKQHTDKVTVPAKNGFKWQLSIGANPITTEYLDAGNETTVNGRVVTGPLTISRKTELGEISFVPLGADGNTSAKVTASKGSFAMNELMLRAALKAGMAAMVAAGKTAKYSDEDIDKMDAKTARSALKKCMKAKSADDEEDDDDDEDDDDEESKSAKSRKRVQIELRTYMEQFRKESGVELKRQSSINAAATRYGVKQIEIEQDGKKVKVDLAAHAIQENWSAELAELHALRAARPGAGVGVPGGLAYSTSNPELNDAVLEFAVFQAGRHQFRLEDDDFYFDEMTVNGNTVKTRRVPQSLQKEAQQGMKARYSDQVQQAAHTMFRGRITLCELLAASGRGNGYTGSGRARDDSDVTALLRCQNWGPVQANGGMTPQAAILAEGTSTANIANILANVLNKFMLQGYLFVEQAWRQIRAIRPVNDFKPTKSINLLGDVAFKQVGMSGELANASLSDQAFANQADQYGRILTINRKNIINDDLGILTTSPMKLGQGAGLALNLLIWTLFNNLANLLADDGNSFFANTAGAHGTTNATILTALQTLGNANLLASGASSALSSSSLQTAKQMYDKQIDPNGNPLGYDNGKPILLFPPELWVTAMELVDPTQQGTLVYGGASAAKQPNVNMWKGRMTPVMSRYLSNNQLFPTTYSTTAWYVLFEAMMLAAIEVCFLNGVDTPTVQTASPDFQFDRLGVSIRGILDMGVNQQNYRAVVRSPGA